MPTWVQDPETGEMIPKEKWLEHKYGDHPPENLTARIQEDIAPFVSPVDGSVITGRKALSEHNKRHGVTNIRDYGDQYFERRQKELSNNTLGNTREAKRDRVEAIKKAISEVDKHHGNP